jgi:hypothetical protein
MPVPNNYADLLPRPFFGILIAFLCTFLWCTFLIWLVI